MKGRDMWEGAGSARSNPLFARDHAFLTPSKIYILRARVRGAKINCRGEIAFFNKMKITDKRNRKLKKINVYFSILIK